MVFVYLITILIHDLFSIMYISPPMSLSVCPNSPLLVPAVMTLSCC
jgi:hypothetical protein